MKTEGVDYKEYKDTKYTAEKKTVNSENWGIFHLSCWQICLHVFCSLYLVIDEALNEWMRHVAFYFNNEASNYPNFDCFKV